jgi:antitoxin component HigA of HigAB toxin-antitoxin module
MVVSGGCVGTHEEYRKRKLSLEMIRKISDQLHIPSDVLIQVY